MIRVKKCGKLPRAVRGMALSVGIAGAAMVPMGVLAESSGVAAATTLPPAPSGLQAELVAAAEAAAAESAASGTAAGIHIHPDTIEPINTQFNVTSTFGCEGSSMYGNIFGAAYGKVNITSGSGCGIAVYVVADQGGSVVYGSVESTSTSTWAQSTVDSATVIGEAVEMCDSSNDCVSDDYTPF